MHLIFRVTTLNKRRFLSKFTGYRIMNATKKNGSSVPCLEKLVPPAYVDFRLQYWKTLRDNYLLDLTEKIRVNNEKHISIRVKLSDSEEVSVPTQPYKSTSLDIISSIDPKLSAKTLAVKCNDRVCDAFEPLVENCIITPLTFESKEGNEVFWHSSAHVLGEAMEMIYGGDLCYGPTIENGFFYDMYMPDNTISGDGIKMVEDLARKFVKEKQPFEKLVVSKDQLMKLFAGNPFKQRIIKEKINTETATVYRCGSLVDLCRGPHLPNTSMITALKLIKNSSSYWEGDATKEPLQRMYGISFPSKQQMADWVKFQEQAAARNHRKLGIDQELFFFNEISPGSCFFLPKGAHIYNKLVELMKNEYRNRGFEEVISPNVFNQKLWEQSGHWEHYADNMFCFEVEKSKFALKPMNCPGHCIMYSLRQRSWKELPIRFADFGVLHRNELSGALSGLTRVRRFQQDDAHIFCMPEQLKAEIRNCIEFMKWTYGVFGFKFRLQLSTRPEKYLGDIKTWNTAEQQLEEALNESNEEWTLNPADGAFYGPKIDVTISDAMNRQHQCATIQLDFQLPARFNLTYVSGEDNTFSRPVMIHRAILGSIERMLGIVTEHYGGKWPFWLSPRQVCVISVTSNHDDYAKSIQRRLYKEKFETECKLEPTMSLNKKIRTAQIEQFNFILVVGENEFKNKSVNVRLRDGKTYGEMTIEEFLRRLNVLSVYRSNSECDDFDDIDTLIGQIKRI
ncbi:hypothetical protein GJ496_001908 [Pomphorhynchus laevis]|nr:hypothetical protein GJ496_001908 [Pomphorhynchus laevis]